MGCAKVCMTRTSTAREELLGTSTHPPSLILPCPSLIPVPFRGHEREPPLAPSIERPPLGQALPRRGGVRSRTLEPLRAPTWVLVHSLDV
jgi:hypothetical protein